MLTTVKTALLKVLRSVLDCAAGLDGVLILTGLLSMFFGWFENSDLRARLYPEYSWGVGNVTAFWASCIMVVVGGLRLAIRFLVYKVWHRTSNRRPRSGSRPAPLRLTTFLAALLLPIAGVATVIFLLPTVLPHREGSGELQLSNLLALLNAGSIFLVILDIIRREDAESRESDPVKIRRGRARRHRWNSDSWY